MILGYGLQRNVRAENVPPGWVSHCYREDDAVERTIFTEEHDGFRELVARFAADEIVPHHLDWEDEGQVPRELWTKAGALGLLCTDVPTEYGGGGVRDFRFNSVVTEELSRVGASGVGFPLHNDVIVPY